MIGPREGAEISADNHGHGANLVERQFKYQAAYNKPARKKLDRLVNSDRRQQSEYIAGQIIIARGDEIAHGPMQHN